MAVFVLPSAKDTTAFYNENIYSRPATQKIMCKKLNELNQGHPTPTPLFALMGMALSTRGNLLFTAHL